MTTTRTGLYTQLGLAKETTYGTYVAPSRFLEFNDEKVKLASGRIEGKGLRSGQRLLRQDHRRLGRQDAAGEITFEVGDKGFGLLFQLMLGAVATTHPGTLAYCHTATLGDPFGLSASVQIGRPDTGGTVNPFSYTGGKVDTWELDSDLDGIMLAKVGFDFQNESTAQTLAAASAPTETELFIWTGAAFTIGGTAFPIDKGSLKGNMGLKKDRFLQNATNLKSEPLADKFAAITGSLQGEFDVHGLTNYGFFQGATTAAVVMTWTGSLIEAGHTRQVVVTLPCCMFDGETPNVSGQGIVPLTLPFKVLDDGSDVPISVAYTTSDSTP